MTVGDSAQDLVKGFSQNELVFAHSFSGPVLKDNFEAATLPAVPSFG